MSYTPKAWGTGDNVNLADLIHIETQYSLALDALAAHVAAGHPTVYRPISEMDSYFWHAGNDGTGSGLNVDTLEGVHASEIAGGVDPGIMCWWDPRNGAVPSGFVFCDGQNGTYDMRGRYPIGASATIPVGSTIGNSSITPVGSVTIANYALTVANIHHTHTAEDSYNYSRSIDTGYSQCANNVVDQTINTSSVGGGGSHTHPGTFTGDAKSLDPLSQYLVIIQKA